MCSFGLSAVVLHHARVKVILSADLHAPKPDHCVVSLRGDTSPNTNQKPKLESGERHFHLGEQDGSRGVVIVGKPRNDNVVAMDASQRVYTHCDLPQVEPAVHVPRPTSATPGSAPRASGRSTPPHRRCGSISSAS